MQKSLPEAQERQLIEQARRHPDAFRALYRHYFPRVYAYAAARVGRRQDAEDVVADVFLHVVEALASFDYRGAGSFAAWIFRIAHNRVSQHYRDHGTADVALDDVGDLHSDRPPPDEALADKELAAHLRGLVRKLPPRRQEVITLKFFGGLRNTEIAAVLELDERTVASHLCRALDDLQRMVTANELEKENPT